MSATVFSRAPTVQEAIRQRGSVRAYGPGKLSWSTVTALLGAAVRAPTAMHLEPWSFVVIQNAEILRALSDRARLLFAEEPHPELLHRGGHALDVFTRQDFDVFHGAGTLIVIGSQLEGPFVAADCWLAAANVMLEAHALGLGSCVVGSALSALNLPETKSVLNVPNDFTAIAAIVVGEPAGPITPTPRQEPRVLAWI